MMKWLMILVLSVMAFFSWQTYSKSGSEIQQLELKIQGLRENGDPEGIVPKTSNDLTSLESDRVISGIFLTFLTAGIAGIFFVVYLLPFFAQRVTHAVYDSAEQVERDAMYAARSLLAQGDYHGAIEAFKEAAAADPLNRLPWVEIVKIHKDNLEDPATAIQTIRDVLQSQEWEVNDAAYFLFRLAELYDEVNGDRVTAIEIMNQVVQDFPGTRHSANAAHKLHEWHADESVMGDGGEATPSAENIALADEEAEYFANLARKEQDQQQQ